MKLNSSHAETFIPDEQYLKVDWLNFQNKLHLAEELKNVHAFCSKNTPIRMPPE